MIFLLQHLLSESARKYPYKIAIEYQNQNITYRELEEFSNKLANTLTDIGVKNGNRVGIYTPKTIESIISIFGVLKAGGIYVPIASEAPVKRIEYIVRNCGIKHLISTGNKIEKLEGIFSTDCPIEKLIIANSDSRIPHLLADVIKWEEIMTSGRSEQPASNLVDQDLAYILYTSGSTGEPKGVMISHLNSLTFVNWAQEFFKIQKNDKVGSHAPLCFDLSVFDIFAAIKAGATIVIVPENLSVFPFKLAEFIEKSGITVWNSVPSALTLLINRGKMERFKFPYLRLVLFAGEIFPLKYLRQLKNLIPDAEFYNQYGQTEANSSTYYHVQHIPDDNGRLPIGKAAANFEVFALDDENRVISQLGQIGELYVHGSSVAQGYWGDINKTRSAFVNNPLKADSRDIVYKTNDLVTLDKDGNYIFVSRKDNMVKSRGYRIELGEIETVISRHPEVKEVAVVAVPDEIIGNRLKACVVTVKPESLTCHDLEKYCSESLPGYMTPEIIEFHRQLPMTSTGKIDKRLLTIKATGDIRTKAV